MAGLQQRNGSYRILFRHQGKQHAFTLGKVSEKEAETKVSHVDYLLMRLEQRLAVVPSGMSIVDYVQFDGQADIQKTDEPVEPKPEEILTLKAFQAKYMAANEASLEATTLDGIGLHFKYFSKILGEQFPIAKLLLANLQDYVDKRRKAKGRNDRTLSPATIEKEIITLRTAWNWGVEMKLVEGKFPNQGLRYPKYSEKPPFSTRAEIERQIAGGGLSPGEIADLYDAMYLTVAEMGEFLSDMKTATAPPYLLPMITFAAYTGARRSEIVRTRVADVDFDANMVTIHERKRVRGKLTTRRVPLSPVLTKVLKDWLAIHPGTPFLFSQHADVSRHDVQGPASRRTRTKVASIQNGKPETNVVVTPVTPDDAGDRLHDALAGKWTVLKGWHTLRHSFISACASKGVDQRMLQAWVGHMSERTNRRYAHLYPSTQQQALASVFG